MTVYALDGLTVLSKPGMTGVRQERDTKSANIFLWKILEESGRIWKILFTFATISVKVDSKWSDSSVNIMQKWTTSGE